VARAVASRAGLVAACLTEASRGCGGAEELASLVATADEGNDAAGRKRIAFWRQRRMMTFFTLRDIRLCLEPEHLLELELKPGRERECSFRCSAFDRCQGFRLLPESRLCQLFLFDRCSNFATTMRPCLPCAPYVKKYNGLPDGQSCVPAATGQKHGTSVYKLLCRPPNRDPLTFAKTVMYDLERGLNAYKYKWSGTDPEPTNSSRRRRAPKRKPLQDFLQKTRRVLGDTGRQKEEKRNSDQYYKSSRIQA
uniref:DUF4776 domain-containing protein n=1 Tax=Macrostomum lignano TaxID=282301 RepID=A0A1I8FBK2_9PLAT